MDYAYETAPFPHQDEHFLRTRDLNAWGLFWEQGCGKTKPLIDKAAYLYEKGEIDCLLVVAPNGVHRNWINEEMPIHLPARLQSRTHCFFWDGDKKNSKRHQAAAERALRWDGLVVIAISYDAFMTDKGKKWVWRVLQRRRCFYVLDEADNIATVNIRRSKSIVMSSVYAPYRGVATGTPVRTGPFDVYNQVRFLDRDFWQKEGIGSTYAEYKAFFGEFRYDPFKFEELRRAGCAPAEWNQLKRYKNLDILEKLVKKIADRETKESVGLKLPPKLYSKRFFELSPVARKAYDTLVSELELELDNGEIVDGRLAIVRLLRLQQIASGYVAYDADEPVALLGDRNPRLDGCVEYMETLNHQAIVWAKFNMDVDQIVDALGPKRCARYDGMISDDECERNKLAFQGGEKQFFVSKAQKGGSGLTLNQAKTSFYYNNTFRLKDRLQSEDRNHRIGQEGCGTLWDGVWYDSAVHYVDSIAVDTVDTKILASLRAKFDIATQITGDKLKEWI